MKIEIRTQPYPHINSFVGREALERSDMFGRYIVSLWKWKIIKLFLEPPKEH